MDGPSTSSQISVPKPTPAGVNIFSVEKTSFSLSLGASMTKIIPQSLEQGILH